MGYPKWYGKTINTIARGGDSVGRWSGQRNTWRTAGNVPFSNSVNCVGSDRDDTSSVTITHQHFEQLLKLIPGYASGHTSQEDPDTPFSGIITRNSVESLVHEWIVNSGVSDYLTCFKFVAQC